MKLYVWYSNSTSVTGRELANSIGLSRTSPNDRNRGYGTLPPPKYTTHCVVWGAKYNGERYFPGINFLNDAKLVHRYSNKCLALEQMQVKGVTIPRFTDVKGYAETMLDEGLELIGRRYSHQGGSSFKFIEDSYDLNNDTTSDFWLEYKETEREYRVHVFNGEIVKIQRKKPKLDEEGDEIEPDSHLCKSHDNGWRFSICDISRVHEDIKRQALKAVEAIGYDFGAVDILRLPDEDKSYVLEVNSGMGLDNAGLELYTELVNDWYSSQGGENEF